MVIAWMFQLDYKQYFKPTSLSGAGGATPSASLLGLDDGVASPAASRLASEAAALGANVTAIMNTSTKVSSRPQYLELFIRATTCLLGIEKI